MQPRLAGRWAEGDRKRRDADERDRGKLPEPVDPGADREGDRNRGGRGDRGPHLAVRASARANADHAAADPDRGGEEEAHGS